MFKIKNSIFVFALLLISAQSFAIPLPADKCYWYTKSWTGKNYTVDNIVSTRSWGTSITPRSAKIGAIITTETQSNQGDQKGYSGLGCGSSAIVEGKFLSTLDENQVTPQGYPEATGKVYKTNTPGIGMIMKTKGEKWGGNNEFFPISYVGANKDYTKSTIFAVILVKTGDIPPGMHTVLGMATLSTSGTVFETVTFYINVFADSCSVAAKGVPIEVPMGSVPAMRLKSPTTAGGEMATFSIPLTNCVTGSTSSNIAEIHFNGIGGSAIVDGPGGVLGLDSSSGAKGVGIQILKEDGVTPLPLGFATPAGQINPGNTRLKFLTRYVKTNNTPQPGSANARANFTVSYK